ncbi:hypothetical protein LTR70_000857 [Exophiala xenobiotica]|uniref:Zn(2)-C6 fungal-type domain-containing protein n=1 Tax=Lithohypha guttulata TaxID=1690604 RepID=A0ABR0KKA0_9EURO|nr:hypothetical protein LTR24_001649 [Lithohypha guttulata]KAK5329021.1 hypothetical protein LTR70_000857 [Exophiala xenobiotica]
MESPKQERVARRRQDPVSCRLCRLKKLKCNRQNPCSNCVARGAQCEFEPNQATASARIQHDAEPSNAAILSRLQRLEDMLTRMNQHLPSTPDALSPRKSDSDFSGPTLLTPAEESHQIESQTLNQIGTQQPSLFPAMSSSFVFETVPLELISKHELESPFLSRRQKRILLPTYSDARTLFDKYAKYVCHFHHIIHLPTLRKILEDFYSRLSRGQTVDPDHGTLLLGVFATVVCYTRWSEPDSVPLEVSDDRENVFQLWFRSALDLLDHSRRILQASLEIVQSCIILVFLDYNLEGFTSRARAVLGQALHSAKELSMHRIDCPHATRRRVASTTIDSMIELEMKRRIWWHLVATDWMVSLAGSAQEGTYTAHPQQMRVRLPRNISDEVLDRGNTTEDLPLTQPTPMSYPLQRVRLGEISRNIVDTLRFGISDVSEHDYDQVMALDRRIQHFLEDLPIFFKLDSESLQKSQYILERYPYFAMQRYIISIGAHSNRCKLHQPFLVRGTDKAKYAESVDICLSSAMEVIKINKAVRHDPTHYIPEKVKLVGLLHHMFLATIVLVMDVCFNRTDGKDDLRSTDVATAIKMLEEAKEYSVSVQKFLDSLMEALKKHHVGLVDDSRKPVEVTPNTQNPWSAMPTWPSTTSQQQVAPLAQDPGVSNTLQPPTLGIDWAWKDILDQTDMNTLPDWEQLFSELDAFIA